jgi:excisionase family DNA binding protein
VADRFITLDEAAAMLRVSPNTIRRSVMQGHIKGMQVNGPGSVWRIDSHDFRDFISKSHKNADAADGAAEGKNDDKITKVIV